MDHTLGSIDPLDRVAVTLLSDLQLWRLRAIERIKLSQAFWSERERVIHVQSLQEVMLRDTPRVRKFREELKFLEIADSHETVELLLPITELPKVHLLDLDITVAGKSVFRVSKDEGARVQAWYLYHLADEADLLHDEPIPDRFIDFLTFIFYFPSHVYRKAWNSFHRSIFTTPEFMYLRSYARDNGQLQSLDIFRIYRECSNHLKVIRELAEDYVIDDPISGSQHPLLSLPYFFEELEARSIFYAHHDPPPGTDEIVTLVTYLADCLRKANEKASTNTSAKRFISNYYSYGYRWMAFARCQIPANKPFIISVQERRTIYLTPKRHVRPGIVQHLRKEVWQGVVFADAETNHVNIRVPDMAVRIKHHPQALDERLDPLDHSTKKPHYPDEQKNTFELYSRKDSKRERPERIYIRCPIRLTRVHSWMLWLTMLITFFAWVLLLIRGIPTLQPEEVPQHGKEYPTAATGLTAKDATLILVPVAFAAALLLVKVDSTLSAWTRRLRQAALMIELFVLLATAFFLLLFQQIKIG